MQKTVSKSRKDWSSKLDNVFWTYITALKTPIGITPFNLIYGKSCHLPLELKYKAIWATKLLNYDIKSAIENCLIQLYELDEIRNDAYDNSKVYKERTKAWHDRKILNKMLKERDKCPPIQLQNQTFSW